MPKQLYLVHSLWPFVRSMAGRNFLSFSRSLGYPGLPSHGARTASIGTTCLPEADSATVRRLAAISLDSWIDCKLSSALFLSSQMTEGM